MRLLVLVAVIVGVAACSDATTPTGTKPPPTTASFDTLLSNGSIPPSGGTLTVSKPGYPLNGLTLTVPSGAFSSAASRLRLGRTTSSRVTFCSGIT